MTRKKDNVKLNKLHLVKRRRMQKYHARYAGKTPLIIIQRKNCTDASTNVT